MPISFVGSPAPTIGVEMELLIVDKATGEVVCAAEQVLVALDASQGQHPRLKPELLQSTVEVVTGICGSVAEARSDLTGSIRQVDDVLSVSGLGAISMGVHPWARRSEVSSSPHERYVNLLESLQWAARRLMSHGVHVHVGVPSADQAIRVVTGIRRHLPVLLALSSSSRYRHGEDTGLASVRMKLMESLPISGPPPVFDDWAEFERFFDAMVAAGAITTERDLWWDARPHPSFGTVEVRVCDAVSDLDDLVPIVALVQCLVVAIGSGAGSGAAAAADVPEWLLRQNMWRAVRFGLDAQFIVSPDGRCRPAREIIRDLAADLAPTADELGCAAELASVGALVERGSSQERQLAVVAHGGDLRDVVAMLRRDLAASVERT